MRRSSDSPAGALSAAAAVIVFAAAVLIVFPAATQTGDSLEYARAVRSGTSLFHPHHLLFNAVIRGFWLGLQSVFPSIDPITAGQVHNILWALAVLAAFFTIVRRLTGSTGAAVVFSLALFSALGFWQYATFVEIYIPSMGCLAVSLVLLLSPRPGPAGPGARTAAAGFFVLAVLYNQMAVFFVLALAVLLTPRLNAREAWRTVRLIAAAGAIVLGAYAAVFFTAARPAASAGFVRWCLSYAFNPDPTWGSFSNVSLLGLCKLFLSFARDVLFIPRSLLVPASIVSGVLCAGLAVPVIRSIARRKPAANARIALVLWILGTALFMWWFSPAGYELSIPLLLPAFLILALISADGWEAGGGAKARRLILSGTAAVVLFVFLFNLTAAVLPAHASRGVDYSRAGLIEKTVPAEATVFADFWLEENLRYYFNRTAVIEEGPVLFSFYRFKDLSPDMIPDPDRPVVASVELLSPRTRPEGLFGGDVQPLEWRAFIEWICGCEIRDGRVTAARTPSPLPGLPEYLLLSGERKPVEGLAGLFRLLDAAAAAAAPEFSGSFSAWLERHPDAAR